jgi:hypothetical protein
MIAILILYIIGAIGTLLFNRAIVVGPINYPFSVLRNAVLWPVFLPILIWAWVK